MTTRFRPNWMSGSILNIAVIRTAWRIRGQCLGLEIRGPRPPAGLRNTSVTNLSISCFPGVVLTSAPVIVLDEVTAPAVAELKRIEKTQEERNALAYALWL